MFGFMSRFLPRFAAAFIAAAATILIAGGVSAAADYPARPVTLVVPYPPGGGVDAMARVVAAKLSDALKQQFIVDNRAGAGGTIGTRAVAQAAPDGYTLLLGHTGTISINPSLYTHAGYDPRKNFAPIGLVASMPVALLAHPSFPAKSIAEFIAIARKDPGKLNLGTSAVGTGGYMCAELFKSEAGINVAIIPYKGTAPVMNDLLGGHVPIAFGVLPPALGNIQGGKLRAIAVTSKKRFSLLPDVPTFDESGLPGFEAVLHYGLLAPAGTPKEIVDRLGAELRRLVELPEVQKQIHNEGGDPLTSTPAEYAADIDKEEKKWSGLVKKLGLKVE
ncbi:MAG: tripartite tricarboxylate transporter substrate binding protein [Pseudolabrys sp.]